MKDCDLVMKGGATSGVVYPHLVSEISKSYRLRAIGGSSAGAIAATMAAAAEYARQRSPGQQDTRGFDRIVELGDALADQLLSLFQPEPQLARPFAIMVAATDGSDRRGMVRKLAGALLHSYRAFWLPPAAVGAFLSVYALLMQGAVGAALFWLLLGGLCAVLLVLFMAYREMFRTLPDTRFGLCTGLGRNPDTRPGLTDWLHRNLQEVAGLDPGDRPLTVGDLAAQGLEVAAMTTDLSSARPYRLPLKTCIFAFSEREFRQLLPADIVDFLKERGGKLDSHPGAPPDLWSLPVGDDFPVLLVARMSLSFPFLIQTVPLYRRDFERDGKPYCRCHFSDGGISSNFPVHFFDSLAPRRPTFGIALGAYDPRRDGTGDDARFVVGARLRDSQRLTYRTLTSVPGFAMAILDTAKDWQDTLQAGLPGYRDRNVEILLDEEEGGLNLRMPADRIAAMGGYGKRAAELLMDNFDFDEHRYVRALATYPKVESALAAVRRACEDDPGYIDLLANYPSGRYRGVPDAWRRDTLAPFVQRLSELGDDNLDIRQTPATDGKVRLVGNADRIPRE